MERRLSDSGKSLLRGAMAANVESSGGGGGGAKNAAMLSMYNKNKGAALFGSKKITGKTSQPVKNEEIMEEDLDAPIVGSIPGPPSGFPGSPALGGAGRRSLAELDSIPGPPSYSPSPSITGRKSLAPYSPKPPPYDPLAEPIVGSIPGPPVGSPLNLGSRQLGSLSSIPGPPPGSPGMYSQSSRANGSLYSSIPGPPDEPPPPSPRFSQAAIGKGAVGVKSPLAASARSLPPRGATHAPAITYNLASPYVNNTIGDMNPFVGKAIHQATPEQFSMCVENALVSVQSLRNAVGKHRMHKSDIMIVGAAPRTGAFAMGKWIDGLLQPEGTAFDERTTLMQRVPWIEEKSHHEKQVMSTPGRNSLSAYVTFLSFKSLQANFAGKAPKEMGKYIVMLREPSDLRLSWFRFIRRIYRKCKNGELESKAGARFDDHFCVDDFASVPVCPFVTAVNVQAMTSTSNLPFNYEMNMLDWIRARDVYPDNIFIAFYEELVQHPIQLMVRISAFLKVDLTAKHATYMMNTYAQNDPAFPRGTAMVAIDELRSVRRRIGSTELGGESFLDVSLAVLDSLWRKVVEDSFRNLTTYEKLFLHVRGERFPLTLRKHPLAPGGGEGEEEDGTNGKPERSKSRKIKKRTSITEIFSAAGRRRPSIPDEKLLGVRVENPESVAQLVASAHPKSYAARITGAMDGGNGSSMETGTSAPGHHRRNSSGLQKALSSLSASSPFSRSSTPKRDSAAAPPPHLQIDDDDSDADF